MNALGTHLLLELKSCNPELLDDLPYLRKALMEAAEETGATIIGDSFHQFSPQGVTGVVAIAESHLCIHTWPEFRLRGRGHIHLRRRVQAPRRRGARRAQP